MKNRQFFKISHTKRVTAFLGFLLSGVCPAVTWEHQAERLQLVSASMLDAQPLLSTINGIDRAFRIEGKAVISGLPKMNATVGNKTEQPPQPPAHSIPTMEASFQERTPWLGAGIARVWQGFLPAAAGKQVGMNATCGQTLTGVSLGFKNDRAGIMVASLEVGSQWSESRVEGGITEVAAKDLFEVKTNIRFVTLTLSPIKAPSLWGQAQIAERVIATRFEIPSDSTVFNLRDSSTIKGGSAATQFSVGYDFGGGFQGAVAYLNIPQRSTVPRLLLSYNMVLGKRSMDFAREGSL